MLVNAEQNHLLIEWELDTMDRGNHNYVTPVHGQLVIEKSNNFLERGTVIYYKMVDTEMKENPAIPRYYLGRVVAMPGEFKMGKPLLGEWMKKLTLTK